MPKNSAPGTVPVIVIDARMVSDQPHGIARYVTVTTTAIERMLKKQRVHIHRVGPAPVRIGNVMTVACFIEVDDETLQAIGL